MNIISIRNQLIVILLVFFQSGIALAKLVEIEFSADISYVSVCTDEYSYDKDESWIDFVNNNITVGSQITGTLRYHTDPYTFTQYYSIDTPPYFSTIDNGEPKFSDAHYLDSFSGLTVNLPSAGLTWSTSTDYPYFWLRSQNQSELRASGNGSSTTFPEELFRSNYEASNHMELGLSIMGDLPGGGVFLQPIDMDNLLIQYGRNIGKITMRENVWTEGLGDYLEISYAVTDVSTTISDVPLPGSLWIFMSGLFGILGFLRGPRSKNA